MRFGPLCCLVCVLSVFAGCGVRTTYDAREGFTPASIDSVRFADTSELEKQYPVIYSDLVDERVRQAITAVLAEKGISVSDAKQADAVVGIDVRTRAVARSSGPSFGIGFGASSGSTSTGVGVGTGPRTETKTIPDLVVTLRDDGAEGDVLWQGVAEGGLKREHRRTAADLQEVVSELFDQPPFDD